MAKRPTQIELAVQSLAEELVDLDRQKEAINLAIRKLLAQQRAPKRKPAAVGEPGEIVPIGK